ncbi:MAG: pilin [Cocleimonas sp.]|nr:pilin [Cocleimonas sp.]
MDFLEKAKLHVELYRQDGSKLSDLDNTATTYTALGLNKNINTEYLRDYWIAPYGGNDITIWVRSKNATGLPQTNAGRWPLYLAGNVENMGIKWQCKSDYSGGVAKKFLPSGCR